MAADKEIMKAIERLRLDRPGRTHQAMWANEIVTGASLTGALAELATTYREEAELWSRSGAKGWKSSEAEKYLVAQHIDDVAALSVSVPPEPERKTAHEWNADPRTDPYVVSWSDFGNSAHKVLGPDFGPETLITLADFERARDGGAVTIARRPAATTHQRLDDFVASAVAAGKGTLHDAPEATKDDVAAYLKGDTDDLPGLAEALVPSSVRDGTVHLGHVELTDNGDGTAGNTEPITWESDTLTPDGHRPPGLAPQAPTLGQPGDMGTGYSHTYIPAGGRAVTFAELLTPVPAASLPPHLSNSQTDTIGDCATKYRLQRVEALPQIPQWANIGGTAFHAAVEAIERMVAKEPDLRLDALDVDVAWKHHFEGQISAVAATTTVPISVWRAARKGAEGEQWWRVQGPLMLRRYLDARPTDVTAEFAIGTGASSAEPAIELDRTADVPTPYGSVQFNAKIDRVSFDRETMTLTIRDYKTSYERPTDTTQLGDYAWVLTLAGHVSQQVKILGSYFDARRGEWTEPVDLLAAHPFEAFQYRVTTAHAQKLALTTGPTSARPSNYCGGCAVRYACPIMAAKS